MSSLQAALQDVGFQPTRLNRAARHALNRAAKLEEAIEEVVEPLIKPRKIQVQRAGALYKVRYEGRADFVFSDGEALAHHKHRLKYFGL